MSLRCCFVSGGAGRDTAARAISFKSQSAGFRPVRFKAPIVITAADIAVAAEQEQTEGISDF